MCVQVFLGVAPWLCRVPLRPKDQRSLELTIPTRRRISPLLLHGEKGLHSWRVIASFARMSTLYAYVPQESRDPFERGRLARRMGPGASQVNPRVWKIR